MAQFSHIAGVPVLDLINTVEWRLSATEREEDLLTYVHVAQWGLESGFLDEQEQAQVVRLARDNAGEAEAERLCVIAFRESAYAAIFCGDQGAADDLAAEYREAITACHLDHDDGRWSWQPTELTLATARHRIAIALIEFMARDDLDRLHQCEDEACGWVYLDTSPRGNRRWCVTADCGDRNRSRAYYARQKAKRSQPDPGMP
ncbi:CGNR zinc finger domain-containing protein [Dermacoccus nishinomiyaensis]